MLTKEWAEREKVRTGDPARIDKTEGSVRRGGLIHNTFVGTTN
jgi:hypothetical protein